MSDTFSLVLRWLWQARSYLEEHNILPFVEKLLKTLVQESDQILNEVTPRDALQHWADAQEKPADPWGKNTQREGLRVN